MKLDQNPVDKRLKAVFLKCIKGTTPGQMKFSAQDLFTKWFLDKGTPYFFLFQKNLSRTNIQYAELVSLITIHWENKHPRKEKENIHFVTAQDFLKGIQEVVDDLLQSKPYSTKNELCKTFLNLYSVLKHTVLLDMLHGSCSVFLPPHMKLDLFKVCSESGYVHSCGKCIFAEPLKIASEDRFLTTVGSYVKQKFLGKKLFLVVYSHEDFSKYDREYAAELRGGLEDVKISAEKYYIGNKPLVRVLQELKSKYGSQLYVADAGDYRTHSKQKREHGVSQDKTLWLMIDRRFNHDGSPSEEQVLICYDQKYRNENPLQIFDENKPAWVAHTTLPHTLAGAMLNITRPIWPSKQVKIYDPFSGTGTTALEALKFPHTSITFNDIAPIAKTLLTDNLYFFGLSNTELNEYVLALKKLSEPRCSEYLSSPNSCSPNAYHAAMALFAEVERTNTDDEWFDVSQEVTDRLSKEGFHFKLRFYLALRTRLRHVAAFRRDTSDPNTAWNKAYREEATTLSFQFERLQKIRKGIQGDTSEPFVETQSAYSKGCTIAPGVYSTQNGGHLRITIRSGEATAMLDERFDLIITDPPYGFNNEVGVTKLAELFANTLQILISLLNPEAQLVIALPEKSHSGRKIPLFATRTWITQEVIAKAEEQGFELVSPSKILPRIRNLFSPPYYWKSERALTRAILHFQFRKKRSSKTEDRCALHSELNTS